MWKEPKLSYLCKTEKFARQRYTEVLKWVRSLGFKLEGFMLDAGCGRGFTAKMFQEIGCTIIGLDISKELAKSAFSKGITVIVGDIQNPPFKPEVFDVIVCFEVLEHIPNIKRTLNAINKLLKKGGLFISTIPLLHPLNIIVDFIRGETTHINNLSKNVWLQIVREYFEVVGVKTIFIPPLPPTLYGRYFILNLGSFNSHMWICCVKH